MRGIDKLTFGRKDIQRGALLSLLLKLASVPGRHLAWHHLRK